MATQNKDLSRRLFLGGVVGTGVLGALSFGAQPLIAAAPENLFRPIPSSGERVPVMGLGSYLTLDVGNNVRDIAARADVVRAFFEEGGGMIDSSPMYGSAQQVIGKILARLGSSKSLFSATKVWTPTRFLGVQQMNNSFDLWGVEKMDLMQVHNLVDWETHLETLADWKKQGRVRYVGVTTSHGRAHRTLERVLATQDIDFVQLTYNLLDRDVERRLLPLAQEKGIAVIVNRPFRRGGLFDRFEGKPLPSWAPEIGAQNWAQFMLKFVISHPAVTTVIPATRRVDHLRENMAAGRGTVPDTAQRRRMLDYIKTV